jgi:S-formylglutathione hydrolase FrmB
MAFLELKYFSPALGKQIAANVILPEGDHQGPFATFYLLHGLSDDHTMWVRRTNVERYVADLPLMVIMPDTGRGWYTDATHGMAWGTSITRDLVGYIDRMFNTKKDRSGRCVAGLSMGGYGALRLALGNPDIFSSTVSHSGALNFAHDPKFVEERGPWAEEILRIIGDQITSGPNDLYKLAADLPVDQRPAVRIDCGVDDFLIESNREYHAYLDSIGYPHEYVEWPGEHNWDYWDLHIRETIQFHARNLGLIPTTEPTKE